MQFKWIDTHTYPDYNVVLTKKYVKAVCEQRNLFIEREALEVLRRMLSGKRNFFIEEACSWVKKDGRRRIMHKDVLAIVEKFFPELVFLLEEISLKYKIVKLYLNENRWNGYIYLPEYQIEAKKMEIMGFKKIYPHFYFIERCL